VVDNVTGGVFDFSVDGGFVMDEVGAARLLARWRSGLE
jgi:hypothetical protein